MGITWLYQQCCHAVLVGGIQLSLIVDISPKGTMPETIFKDGIFQEHCLGLQLPESMRMDLSQPKSLIIISLLLPATFHHQPLWGHKPSSDGSGIFRSLQTASDLSVPGTLSSIPRAVQLKKKDKEARFSQGSLLCLLHLSRAVLSVVKYDISPPIRYFIFGSAVPLSLLSLVLL